MRVKLALFLGFIIFVALVLLNAEASASIQDMVEVRWNLATVAVVLNTAFALATLFAFLVGMLWELVHLPFTLDKRF